MISTIKSLMYVHTTRLGVIFLLKEQMSHLSEFTDSVISERVGHGFESVCKEKQ